jgi:acetoacetyl-CoA synthetase
MPADVLWSPRADRVESSRLKQFIDRFAPGFEDYAALHRWSVTQPTAFWKAVADHCGLELAREPVSIVTDFDRMPGARWFEGATLSYAGNLLSGDADRKAIVFASERGDRRELTLGELRRQVAAVAAALESFGIRQGDRVAGILPNSPDCVVAALAATSIGAVWSSCSPDFGTDSLLDRLRQIGPKLIFGVDGYRYAGKTIDCLPRLAQVVGELASVGRVVVSPYIGSGLPCLPNLPDAVPFPELIAADAGLASADTGLASADTGLASADVPLYADVAFDHPLFIMFSSGTTGPPKCIVHGTGGTLLQHLKEHQLHCDIRPGDRVFYYTTTGWMMWNWLLSTLASGATLVLYDGAPLDPDPGVLWRLIDEERVTAFGTSARYLSALEKTGFAPAKQMALENLKTIFSTGSPLAPSSFDYVYDRIKGDLHLASISGGTDLISCFVLGNPMLPIRRGEIQCKGLGMDVRILDPAGNEIRGAKGELVCASPFPSMPVGFWNDPTGSAYASAYFERYPGVWHHGDFAELTVEGGIVMHGRSDATLNPGGIRIGTAEIYRILERLPEVADAVVVGQSWDGDTRIVLFVVPAAGHPLDDGLIATIRSALRAGASPHHVPARIVAVGDIPRTLSGKISERAVHDAVHGRDIANVKALANPDALAEFRNRAELRT